VPLAAENREAAGVQAGDDIVVDIENDTAPREVDLPADLAEAMDDAARAAETKRAQDIVASDCK